MQKCASGTIRVGNALGKGQAATARKAAYTATFLAIVTAFIVACIMTSLRWTLPRIYSSWDVAIEIAAGVCCGA
jgi:Na+-driven multidrug efflux pump